MKPIAMRCTEQQFEEIRPILDKNGLNIINITDFQNCPYLVNNAQNKLGNINNFTKNSQYSHTRRVFENWDMNTFLEYCDIKLELPKSFAIKHKPCELWDKYIEWLNKKYNVYYKGTDIQMFYGVNSNGNTDIHSAISHFDEEAVELTLEEWDKIVNKTKTMNKLTVKAVDVLRIHAIVCSTWQSKIVKDYLPRTNSNGEITFHQDEINEGFKAAKTASNSSEVIALLEEIFGKQVQPIDYDKIKTGSKVMLKNTGQLCHGLSSCNTKKPFTVVFYKTPHFITPSNNFIKKGTYNFYCTFNQDGKFVLFAVDKNVDYITEVIEY